MATQTALLWNRNHYKLKIYCASIYKQLQFCTYCLCSNVQGQINFKNKNRMPHVTLVDLNCSMATDTEIRSTLHRQSLDWLPVSSKNSADKRTKKSQFTAIVSSKNNHIKYSSRGLYRLMLMSYVLHNSVMTMTTNRIYYVSLMDYL